MTTEINSNAKRVWEVLENAISGVPVEELCKQLALTFEEVMTAIRWIAHEHNIGLSSNVGQLMVIGVHAD